LWNTVNFNSNALGKELLFPIKFIFSV